MKTYIFTHSQIFDSKNAWKHFTKTFALNKKEIKKINKKYFVPAKLGKLNKKELVLELSKALNVTPKAIMDNAEEAGRMIKIKRKNMRNAMKMKKQGHTVILIGNTTALFASLPVEKETYKKFSKVFLSYKIGYLRNNSKFMKSIKKEIGNFR